MFIPLCRNMTIFFFFLISLTKIWNHSFKMRFIVKIENVHIAVILFSGFHTFHTFLKMIIYYDTWHKLVTMQEQFLFPQHLPIISPLAPPYPPSPFFIHLISPPSVSSHFFHYSPPWPSSHWPLSCLCKRHCRHFPARLTALIQRNANSLQPDPVSFQCYPNRAVQPSWNQHHECFHHSY